MPQLDSLRAFAVMVVMLHHYLPQAQLGLWAIAGVKLFFTLSGFLITGILLKSREYCETRGMSWGFALRQFYARRFLRIFPLYYFVICIALILNLPPARQLLGWLLTYTLNFYMAKNGYVENFAHFWTLAVEQQFYVIWPWFMLFIPRKAMMPLCVLLILISPAYRFFKIVTGFQGLETYISTFACLDSLCVGAFLVMLMRSNAETSRLKKIVLPLGLLSSVLLAALANPYWKPFTVFFDTGLGLFFFWLLGEAAVGFRGWAGSILESRALRYLGKISYGLYVYHPFAPGICRFLLSKAGLPSVSHGSLTSVAVYSALTLVISSLSWYFMEQPINNLKRYFDYVPEKK